MGPLLKKPATQNQAASCELKTTHPKRGRRNKKSFRQQVAAGSKSGACQLGETLRGGSGGRKDKEAPEAPGGFEVWGPVQES